MIIGRGNPCENDAFEFKAAILDFGRQEQNGKRYSLANNKNGFSTEKHLRKAYLPTLTPKCLGLSKYPKTGLVYITFKRMRSLVKMPHVSINITMVSAHVQSVH